MSVRESVVAAALAKLNAITGVAGLSIERERGGADSLTAAELPKLLLFEGVETEVTAFSFEQSFRLQLIVMGAVRAASDVAAATALNTLRAKADQAMLADTSLGGAARIVELDPEFEAQEPTIEGGPVARAFLKAYQVEYAIAEGDPFTSRT